MIRDVTERFVYKDDDVLEKPFNWAQLRRLLKYMAPYKRWAVVAVGATLIGTAARLSVPYLISKAIDKAIRPGNLVLLNWLAVTLMVCYLLNWAANTVRIRITNRIGQRVLYDLRQELFSHIQYLSFEFFDRRSAGSILVRITNDVNSLQELFTNGVVSIMIDVVTVISIAIIMMTIHPVLAILSMAVLPLMTILSTGIRLRIRRGWQEVRLRLSRINAHLNEAIQGIRVTQAFVQERENISFFDNMNDDYRRTWNRSSRIGDAFNPMVELTGAVGTCAVFWYGAYLVRTGELSLGLLVAFATYVGNFWEPISRLGQVYNQMLQAMASSERIFEFMDIKPNVHERAQAVDIPPIKGMVRFENVVFEYERGQRVLDGINLVAEPGEVVALVGPTGAGKSTIINLMCRFYDVTDGRVTIDGYDVRDVTLDSLRSQLGIVLQDTFIFSGSIMDNIRFGRPEATDEEVISAAKAARAHDFIVQLPEGYETEVFERGSRISMGQRQLISFARAILAEPRILILDEATASIDTETEILIQEAMARLLAARTCFVVAHRLSTIRNADKIIVLQDGRIVETGKHHELMARRGIYYELVEAQFKIFEWSG